MVEREIERETEEGGEGQGKEGVEKARLDWAVTQAKSLKLLLNAVALLHSSLFWFGIFVVVFGFAFASVGIYVLS